MIGGFIFLSAFSISCFLTAYFFWKKDLEESKARHCKRLENLREARQKQEEEHAQFMAEHEQFMNKFKRRI